MRPKKKHSISCKQVSTKLCCWLTMQVIADAPLTAIKSETIEFSLNGLLGTFDKLKTIFRMPGDNFNKYLT